MLIYVLEGAILTNFLALGVKIWLLLPPPNPSFSDQICLFPALCCPALPSPSPFPPSPPSPTILPPLLLSFCSGARGKALALCASGASCGAEPPFTTAKLYNKSFYIFCTAFYTGQNSDSELIREDYQKPVICSKLRGKMSYQIWRDWFYISLLSLLI